jgi:ApaG protein
MANKISEGMEVSVETFYQPDYSNPISGEYMFAYRITIENHNGFAVKLQRRHWHIFDSNGSYREVEGEGVVGVQPILSPAKDTNMSAVAICGRKWERCTARIPWRISTIRRPSR